MTLRVTIITPTYNHARYIDACIASVLAQTVPDWEMIVVDDGSTDDTAARVARCVDPRVRLIRMPHRGLAALHETYNTALAEARGDLIAILEGDDFWPARKLEHQLPLFDDDDVTIAWGASMYVDAAGAPIRRVGKVRAPRGGVVRIPLRELFLRLTRENLLTPTLTVMVRAHALRGIGGFQQTGARNVVDFPTWLALSSQMDGSALYLDEVLGCYRVHPMQTTAMRPAELVADLRTMVFAAVARLDDAARARVGWTERMAADVEATTSMLEATVDLSAHRFAQARDRFARALRGSHRPAERARAAAGWLCATARIDGFGIARALRNRAAGLTLRRGRSPGDAA